MEPGRTKTFTAATTDGGSVTADLWFRCYGVRVNGGYLGAFAAARTPQGQIRVTDTLNVVGHEHIYALGDLTALAEAKMAGYAMKHAEVIAENITAQLRGERPAATYVPAPTPSVLLPLGPDGGVGQVPTPDGPTVLLTRRSASTRARTSSRGASRSCSARRDPPSQSAKTAGTLLSRTTRARSSTSLARSASLKPTGSSSTRRQVSA